MEATCIRCHQTVETGASYCPYCGLPQLVYSAEAGAENGQAARWDEAVRDASSVAWRPALRSAALLAVPAGLAGSFLGVSGLVLMAFAGAWVVSIYMRNQRPAWITIGAGARIGLAFGLIAGWLAFAASGSALFIDRYGLHQGAQIDSEWKQFVQLDNQMTQKFANWMGAQDQAQAAETESRMLSPEGHAAMVTAGMAWSSLLLTLFAMLGGAIGARMQVRRRTKV